MKKKVLVCFGEELENNEDFSSYAEKFVENGFEIQVFGHIVDMDVQPYNVLNILDYTWKEDIDSNEYYFLSNIKDFFKLVYRTFHHTFSQFILWQDKSIAYTVELDPIYQCILDKEVLKEEALYKNIYVNDMNLSIEEGFFNDKRISVENFFVDNNDEKEIKQQTIYRFQGQCYLLEAAIGDACYVNLDDEKVEDDVKYADIITPFELNSGTLSSLEEILELVAKDYETCLRRQEIVHKVLSMVRNDVLVSNKVQQKYYTSLLEVMGESYGIYAEVLVSSLLLQIYRESIYYENILSLCLKNKQITAANKYFILAQSKHIELFDRDKNENEILVLETELFEQICVQFKEEVKDEIIDIKNEDIDSNTIVVMTSQFLGYSHPNSQYTLELCKYIKDVLNKEVWLFNTCEYLSQTARVPFFDVTAGNILEEYSAGTKIKFEETLIPFYQMLTPMPNYSGITGILEFLQEKKPFLIINVSDISVVAEICSEQTKTISLFNENSNKLFVPAGQYMVVNEEALPKLNALNEKYNKKILKVDKEINIENLTKKNLLDDIISKIKQ